MYLFILLAYYIVRRIIKPLADKGYVPKTIFKKGSNVVGGSHFDEWRIVIFVNTFDLYYKLVYIHILSYLTKVYKYWYTVYVMNRVVSRILIVFSIIIISRRHVLRAMTLFRKAYMIYYKIYFYTSELMISPAYISQQKIIKIIISFFSILYLKVFNILNQHKEAILDSYDKNIEAKYIIPAIMKSFFLKKDAYTTISILYFFSKKKILIEWYTLLKYVNVNYHKKRELYIKQFFCFLNLFKKTFKKLSLALFKLLDEDITFEAFFFYLEIVISNNILNTKGWIQHFYRHVSSKKNFLIIVFFLQILVLFFFFFKVPKLFFFKVLLKHAYFLGLIYFVFLTLSFLHFTNYFSRNNSFLARFWRRSIILFWLIELFTFSIFLYLTLLSPELNKLYFVKKHHLIFVSKYSYFNQFYLMFVLSSLNICLTLNLKNKNFFSLNFYKLLSVVIVLLLLHFFFFEFLKFFFLLSYYRKHSYEFVPLATYTKDIFNISLEKSLIENIYNAQKKTEVVFNHFFTDNIFLKKRKVLKNIKNQTKKHFMFLISLLKFWHVLFVFLFLLVSLKSFYLDNFNSATDIISANILNINFLLIFNLLSYFLLLKQTFYRLSLLRYNILYYLTWDNINVVWKELYNLFFNF